MITDAQIEKIANDLETLFETEFMDEVRKVWEQLEDIYEEHITSGGFARCREVGFNYDFLLTTEDNPYWDRIWFSPSFDHGGERTFVVFTKGLGEGCHFGDKGCVQAYYNRFHDEIFGSHFHATNWAGDCGHYSRVPTIEFVKSNLTHPDTIINAKSRIRGLKSRLDELRKLPKLVRKALKSASEMAKSDIKEIDSKLLNAFGM